MATLQGQLQILACGSQSCWVPGEAEGSAKVQGMQECPCMALLVQVSITWHCSPGTAKGAACSTGLESSWDPALEVWGEAVGLIPHPQTAAVARLLAGKVPWLGLAPGLMQCWHQGAAGLLGIEQESPGDSNIPGTAGAG